MATYKLDVVSRLGKFHWAFWEATAKKGEPLQNPANESIEDVVNGVKSTVTEKGLDEENDSIIFRSIAYDNYGQLYRELKMANY